jgi:hypothetical protein
MILANKAYSVLLETAWHVNMGAYQVMHFVNLIKAAT